MLHNCDSILVNSDEHEDFKLVEDLIELSNFNLKILVISQVEIKLRITSKWLSKIRLLRVTVLTLKDKMQKGLQNKISPCIEVVGSICVVIHAQHLVATY